MKAVLAVLLLVIATICTLAQAQEMTGDSWYKKSQELFDKGSYEESIKALDEAIELSSGNATLWDAKAASLARAAMYSNFSSMSLNRSEYNESLLAQDRAIELDPDNSALRLHKGFYLANLADMSGHDQSLYHAALDEFENATDLDPENKEAWVWKGSVLDTRLSRYEEAIAAYDRAIGIANVSDDTWLANAYQGRGGALAKLGRYNESFESLDKALELNPQSAPTIWYQKAVTLNASGRYDESIKAYDYAINISGANGIAALAYEDKGTALYQIDRYDEAVAAYDKAIGLYSLGPMGGPAWYKKGLALKALVRSSEADAAFAKAKELGYNG